MTLILTIRKKEKTKNSAKVFLSKEKLTIRPVAQLLGDRAAVFEEAPFGRLYYLHTEKDKIKALKNSKGNSVCHMTFSEAANLEIAWWEQNITRSLTELRITDTIFTDASNMLEELVPSLGKLMADGLTKERIFI